VELSAESPGEVRAATGEHGGGWARGEPTPWHARGPRAGRSAGPWPVLAPSLARACPGPGRMEFQVPRGRRIKIHPCSIPATIYSSCSSMQATTERRSALRELIERGQFQSQSELHAALVRRGFSASQPALSRDLRALDVAKQGGVYTGRRRRARDAARALRSAGARRRPRSRSSCSCGPVSRARPAPSRARSKPKRSTASSARSPATTRCSSLRVQPKRGLAALRRRVQELL
jgi:hypothetical protein